MKKKPEKKSAGRGKKSSEKKTRDHAPLLKGINKVLRETFACENDGAVAKVCLEVAEEITKSRFGWIGETNENGRLDILAISDPGRKACRRPKSKSVAKIRDMEISGLCSIVLKTGKSTIINNPASHAKIAGISPNHPKLNSFLGVPLIYGNKIFGMIALGNKKSGYGTEDKGKVEALSSAFMEALIRKRQESAMERQNQLLTAILECVEDGIVSCDNQGTLTLFNRATREFHGLPQRSIPAKDWAKHYDLYLADGKTLMKMEDVPLFQALKGNKVSNVEMVINPKAGQARTLLATGRSLVGKKGEKMGAVVSMHDITDRRKSEKKLRESEEVFRTIFEHSGVGVAQLDSRTGRFVRINKAYCHIIGYSPEEITTKTFMEITHPEDLQADLAQRKELLAGRISYFAMEKRYIHKEGYPVWVHLTVTPLDTREEGPHYHIAVIKNISDRKRAEKELEKYQEGLEQLVKDRTAQLESLNQGLEKEIQVRRLAEEKLSQSEELHRITLSSISDAVFITDSSGKFTFIGPNVNIIFGYSFREAEALENIKGLLGAGVLDPERLEEEGEIRNVEVDILDKEGRPHSLLVNIKKVSIQGGTALFSCRDVTDRRRMGDALKLEHEKLVSTMNAIPDGIYIVNANYEIEYINPVIEREFGKVHGRKCHEYFHDRTEVCPWCKIPEVMAGKSTQWEWYSFKNDRYYELFDSPLKNADGSVSKFAIFHDITERKRTEDELKDALRKNRRFTDALDNISSYIYMKNIHRQYTYANKITLELFRCSKEELLGSSDSKFFPAEAAAKIASIDERVLRGETTAEEIEISHKGQGKVVYWEVKRPIHDETGKICGLLGISTDITDQKKATDALRESERKFRGYFELPPVGIALTSPEKGWLELNDKLSRMMGYSKEELKKMSWAEMTYLEDLEPDVIQFNRVLAGEIEGYDIEKRFIRKGGSIIYTHLWLSCVRKPDKTVDYFIALLQDITEKKKMEKELRQAKEEAEEATRWKDKFVSLVAHDLRGPLATFMGFLKLFESETFGSPEERKRIVEMAGNTARKMSSILDNLLYIGRLKSGKIQPLLFQFSGKELVDEVLREFEPSAKKKGIEIHHSLHKGIRFHGDPSLFGDVLRNLLGNAVKFCGKGGVITLFTPAGKPSTLAISDTGVGISTEKLEAIFRYEEKTSTMGTNGEQGTGLGLPLARDLMEIQGGRLWVESEKGKGSVFFAELPSSPPTQD